MSMFNFSLPLNKIRCALRLAGWCAVFAIAVLSLVPGELRPHTEMPGYFEHFSAYFIATLLLSLGHTGRFAIFLSPLLSAYAAILETIQLWVPGRGAAIMDWVSSSMGALTGAIVASVLLAAASKIGGFRKSTSRSSGYYAD